MANPFYMPLPEPIKLTMPEQRLSPITQGLNALALAQTAQLNQAKSALIQEELARRNAFREAAAGGDMESAMRADPELAYKMAQAQAQMKRGGYWEKKTGIEQQNADINKQKVEMEKRVKGLKYLNDALPGITKSTYPKLLEEGEKVYPGGSSFLPSASDVAGWSDEQFEKWKLDTITQGKSRLAEITGQFGLAKAKEITAGRIGAANITAKSKGEKGAYWYPKSGEGSPIWVPQGSNPPVDYVSEKIKVKETGTSKESKGADYWLDPKGLEPPTYVDPAKGEKPPAGYISQKELLKKTGPPKAGKERKLPWGAAPAIKPSAATDEEWKAYNDKMNDPKITPEGKENLKKVAKEKWGEF